MADDTEKKGAGGKGRVSRTHPVLGDSSPEARASRLKTEAVPASMVNELRDRLIAGALPPDKGKPSRGQGLHLGETGDTMVSPVSESSFSEGLDAAQGPMVEEASGNPPVSAAVRPPLEVGDSSTAVGTSQRSLLPMDFLEARPDESKLNDELELRVDKSKPFVDRRRAQQGRETLRHLRETRSKRAVDRGKGDALGDNALFRMVRTLRARRGAIIIGLGLCGGLAVLMSFGPGRTSSPVSTSAAPTASSPATLQLLPGSILEPVAGSLSFPRLPSGLYTGIARGLIPEKDVALTFISRRNGASIGVILGIDGWQSAVVSAIGDDPVITVSSNGWIIRFIAKKIDNQLIVGRWENKTTKEVGEWKVVPMR